MKLFRAQMYSAFAVMLILMTVNEAHAAPRLKSGFARVNGTSLYYESKDQGFPLVFISGGGVMDRRCWDEQFESYGKYFRVIRYDVRGIGKSARPQSTFSHSRDLFALLKFLRVKRAHFIALSVGGAIAIDFTLEHPEMVDRLILAASGVSDDAKAEANMQGLATLTSLTKTEGVERVIQLTLDTPFVISQDNSTARDRIRKIYLDNRDVFESGLPIYMLWQPTRPPASQRLAEIQCPVLVVRGDKDSPLYIALTDKIGMGIKGSRTSIIAGGTHFINLDKPKEFDQIVLEFLDRKKR